MLSVWILMQVLWPMYVRNKIRLHFCLDNVPMDVERGQSDA